MSILWSLETGRPTFRSESEDLPKKNITNSVKKSGETLLLFVAFNRVYYLMNKLLFISFCFLATTVLAQKIDSLDRITIPMLQEIILSDDKLIDWSMGASVQSIDSSLLQYNSYDLAQLLASSSHIRIRTYGALATSSIRGAGASHTQVLWNGISLNSPMTGQYDLSLMPLFFAKNLQVQSGGLSSLLGDGAIGGSVHINNALEFKQAQHYSLLNSLGSFGEFNLGAKASLSTNKTAFEIAIHQHSSKNNFRYTNPYNTTETIKVSHADQFSRALQVSFSKKLSESFRTDFIYFYQEADRLIPPTLYEAFSTAEKEEKAHRYLLKTQFVKESIKWTSNTSFSSDRLIYVDSLKDINANHNTEQYSFTQALEVKLNPRNRFRIEQRALHQIINSKSILGGDNTETRFAVAANYHHTYSNNFAFLLSSRQEFLENQSSPFLPSVGITYSPSKIGLFECSLSRSYRNPSWNDRYWDPGGNPDLKPEDGLMLNVSYLKSIKYKKFETEIKLATYYGKISDWIIWLPENGYWTPGNLALVEQKGLELETNFSLLTKVGVFKFTNLGSLQFSTNLSERVTGDDALGKQLIYVPLLQLNESFSWSRNSWGFTMNYHYESRRFTADDHSSELAAYNIASLAIYKKMNLKYTVLDIGFRIDNLFSQEYQLVQGRPMPGRTLKLNFNYYL